MKKLILPLILLPLSALALDEMRSVSEVGIKNRMMTTVKDVEVERMLGATAEFNDCRKKNEFKSTDSNADRTKKLDAANSCFKQQISGKNADALKKLSEELKLENYGLVKSNTVNDVTVYLSKKMTKALTGRDPDDKSAEALKWENQKIVDQKVFIDLYTNQLVKAALFEVSRFCFENLRRVSTPTVDTFSDHWKLSDISQQGSKGLEAKPPVITDITDTGEPQFKLVKTGTDLSKKEDAFRDIIEGLGTTVDSTTYDIYFKYCQAALPVLCDDFRQQVSARTRGVNDQAVSVIGDNNSVLSQPGATTPQAKTSKGANACLTMDKLQSIRTAMSNTEKVAKQFEEMGEDKDKFAIQMIKNPKIYQRGKADGEESLDELTTMSSTDFLENADSKKFDDLEAKCGQGGGGQECDDFFVKSDSLDKAIHNVESEMNLKREIELEQVRKMKGKPEDLEKYLEANGHFDLLNKLKDKQLTEAQIETELGKVYDARKVAEIENLKLKVGRRQMSEAEYDKVSDKSAYIKPNIQESKQERARLAQVVMFNNIITSQLSLTEKGSGKNVGRNVNAWKKEAKGLESSGINMSLFQGIQQVADKEGSKMEDASVVGGGIIDSILGKKEEKKP